MDGMATKISEAARALGRRGGLKGGPARAKKLGKAGLRRSALKAARTIRKRYTKEEIGAAISRGKKKAARA